MKYGLIGENLSHSYSAAIHGFLGNSEYELLELPSDAVGPFLRAGDFSGVNVTIPYKELVMPLCQLDKTAKAIGSVNTIVNRAGKLAGYNTDYFGFSYMVERAGISFAGKKVAVLGSGGASKTAACVARDGGAREIIVVSRTGEDNYGNIGRHADTDLLINTTPVGMFPGNGQLPLSLAKFPNLSAVIDVVYNPLRTKLLLAAREHGIPTVNGLPMLVAQAFRAHQLFFGMEPGGPGDNAEIEKLLQKTEKRFSNIVLIGMPGCGKTTIGAELARLRGMGFVDTDLAIEAQTGRTIPSIINEDGEARFRELERRIIAEVAVRTNQVIATGGGSILAQGNRELLLQNGTVLFLDRALNRLATDGRPLSVDLGALYHRRLPIYENLCHYKIEITDSLEDNVRKICEVLA